jgi:hypothetical protein
MLSSIDTHIKANLLILDTRCICIKGEFVFRPYLDCMLLFYNPVSTHNTRLIDTINQESRATPQLLLDLRVLKILVNSSVEEEDLELAIFTDFAGLALVSSSQDVNGNFRRTICDIILRHDKRIYCRASGSRCPW